MAARLSPEDQEYAREQFTSGKSCVHCGGLHLRACPRVRRLVYRKADEIAEVEFFKDNQWRDDFIIWPEDAFEDATGLEAMHGQEADAPREARETGETV